MVNAMDFQVVVLAGGTSKNLMPLVSKDVPKALLPVANRPVLSYVLDLLEASLLTDVIVVVEGEENALRVGCWISSVYVDHLNIEVSAVPEDVGTAGAVRAVTHHLTAKDILVVSGDLVCDVSLGAVAATHRRHDATLTALLCDARTKNSDIATSGGKDKGKQTTQYNIIGLDSTRQFLLNMATGIEVEKDIRILKTAIWASGQMEIRSDLMDAHLYAFKRSALQDILDQFHTFHSITSDVVPYMIKSQFLSSQPGSLSGGKLQNGDYWNHGIVSYTDHSWYIQRQMGPVPTLCDLYPSPYASLCVRCMNKCCAYIANRNKYCSRLNTIQAFCDINKDVGANCMLGEGSLLGDKCSVKRSVVGCHCRIGSNVKIANSVVMNHVTIEDGCSLQGSVICSSVHIQERVVLKDCQVGAGYVVVAGSQHRGESLMRKEK